MRRGDGKPEPAPTRICGGNVQPHRARQQGERGSPPRAESLPSHALHRAERAWSYGRPDDDRRERHHRHDDSSKQPEHIPPAVDEQKARPGRGLATSPLRRASRRASVGRDRTGGLKVLRTGARDAGRRAARAGERVRSGTCARKIDSQPRSSVRIPPAAGPSAAPSTPAATQTLRAPSLLNPAPVRRSSADVTTRAAPRAWTHRAPTRTSKDGARPQVREADAKTTTPAANASRGRRRDT